MKRFLLLLLLFSFSFTWSQAIDSIVQPKIGLVLSGGGAKGLAHIGVLKVLEKNHIKPDYITGTSMGAIVGSMYASGYSASQIDSIFRTLNFDRIMFNQYDRKYQHYFKKQRGKKYILSVPFSFHKMSAQLPKGLNNSQQLYNVMAENLWHVSSVTDFSKLHIPFLCFATDISTGEQVLFNKGNLAEAVTLSASLPNVFTPTEIDHKPLLDGGIANNYPVEEVKYMGSDIIIGSDVQGRILQKDEIDDVTKIMDQLVSFKMYERMPLKKAMTDIYIRPNISGIGITDFDKIDTIIKRGEQATTAALQKFDLSKLQNNTSFDRLHYHKPDSLIFDQIVIEGFNHFKREYVLGKIDIHSKQKISYKDFIEGINNLIGTENFQKVHYRFKIEKNKRILYLSLKEKKHKATLNLGFHTNELYGINLIGNFTNKRIFTNNDMISIDFIGGDKLRYNFDYIIDNGFKLSWGLHSSFHQFKHQVRSEAFFHDYNFSVNKLDFNYLQLQNKLFFQANLNHFIYLRAGVQHQYKQLFTQVFSSKDNEAYFFGKNHYLGSFVSINFDNRDDFDIPNKGLYFMLKWNYLGFSSDYYRDFNPYSLINLHLNYTQSIYKRVWIQPDIHIGYFYGKESKIENVYYLGGTQNYLNYDQIVEFKPAEVLSIKATRFFKPSMSINIKTFNNQYITLNSSMLYYEQSNRILTGNTYKLYGFNLGYIIKSFVGPIQVNFGRLPSLQRNHFSFSLGYNF